MNENVNVCITPKGDKPVLHFSQFDNERVFTVTVLADDGESAAVLTGLDIEFRIRKTDSHVVTIAPESVADNVITFKTTEQMCACCGQNIASIVLMDNEMVVSTLDILVDIQRDILSGGLTSESDIRNLTTQIETIIPEVLADDYYTKTEVDDLIDDIPTFDPTNYYDKSDVNGLLADKADVDDVYTKSEVYNKTETDNLLADKADASSVYTKAEVDTALSFKITMPLVFTPSGFPVDFYTVNNAADKCPLPVLKVNVASGDKSARLVSYKGTNIIGGESFAKLFSQDVSDYALDKVNKTFTFSHMSVANPIVIFKMPFKANTQYTFMTSYSAAARNTSLRFVYTDGTSSYCDFTESTKTAYRLVTTANKTVDYIMLGYFGAGLTTLYYEETGIFEGNVAAGDFESFEGNVANIDFGTTLDQAGELDCISGLITLADTNTIQCDGIELDTYNGNNTIYASTGSITELKYYITGTEFFGYVRLIKG